MLAYAYESFQNTQRFRNNIESRLYDVLALYEQRYATEGDIATEEGYINNILIDGIENNQNLLYLVQYKQNTIGENQAGHDLSSFVQKDQVQKLPDGYNFLYFDGEKVYIQKDGNLIDVMEPMVSITRIPAISGMCLVIRMSRTSNHQTDFKVWLMVTENPVSYRYQRDWMINIVDSQKNMKMVLSLLGAVVLIMAVLFIAYIFAAKR